MRCRQHARHNSASHGYMKNTMDITVGRILGEAATVAEVAPWHVGSVI